jgi:hypothetical protein
LAAAWNTYAIDVHGRDWELYPMTAWQMFSGEPKTVARTFVFEIVPDAGAAAVELPGRLMFVADDNLGEVQTRRVLTAVWRSCEYGCPGYRLKGFRDCKKNPVRPWVIPADLADQWLACARKRLSLDHNPHLLRLVVLEQKLDGSGVEAPGASRRHTVFTWKPGSGGYRVEEVP